MTTKHHDIAATDPLPTRSRDLPSHPDSPYGADEERARRAREREQDALDAEIFGKASAANGPASAAGFREHIREIAITAIMQVEGCERERAVEILDTVPPKPKLVTPEEREAKAKAAAHARLREFLMTPVAEGGVGIPVTPEMVDTVIRAEHQRTDATRAAAAWLRDSRRRVLVLLGPVGVGKTIAAALVAVSYARRRQSVRYLREPVLVRWQQSSTLAHEAKFAEFLEADLALVDELGTTLSNKGEQARDAQFATLDGRLGSEGRTIFMGNLTEWRCMTPGCGKAYLAKPQRCTCGGPPAFTEWGSIAALTKAYSGRFVDRLNEVGVIVELSGESMRGRA